MLGAHEEKGDRCGKGRSRNRAGGGRAGARSLCGRETKQRCFRGRAPEAASTAVGAAAGPIARAASCLEGAVAAQAPNGRGGELRAKPVDGTERVLLRWSGQYRQQRLGTRNETRCSQSKKQPLRGQSTWREDGGDPGQPDQHLPPTRCGPAALSHAAADESIPGSQKRTVQLAPGPVETASGGTS